jgi:hypothetical protein
MFLILKFPHDKYNNSISDENMRTHFDRQV